MRPAEMSFVTLMGSEDDRFEQVALDPPTVHPALCSLTDPWECAASLVGDRRQAEGATSCIDRAEGTRPELCPGAPYVAGANRVTVRGSTGARGDRSAEGTYVARSIDSAHSEVVGGTPFQGSDRECRACRCTRLCEAGRRAAAAPDLIVVDVVSFDRRVPGERDLGAACDGRQSSGLGRWCGIGCGCAARDQGQRRHAGSRAASGRRCHPGRLWRHSRGGPRCSGW